jgi:4-diphosphocytidyl-2-C-methyl-D-erythritol kinase
MASVTVRSYAKINLFLGVLGGRPDGYHEIRTVMQTVSLHDRIVLRAAAEGTMLRCDDPDVPSDATNLCARAAEALRNRAARAFLRAGKHGGVHIELSKRIPAGGGLGGGSSNAAATLRGLNFLLGSPLGDDELYAAAAEIGADVPFFLTGGAALATGIGERIEPLPCAAPLWTVLAKPGASMGTAAAYRLLDEVGAGRDGDGKAVARGLAAGDVEQVARGLGNAFWPAVSRALPELAELRHRLLELGAAGACLTGSGSCMFGLFADERQAVRAAREMRSLVPFAEPAVTVAMGHEIVRT